MSHYQRAVIIPAHRCATCQGTGLDHEHACCRDCNGTGIDTHC
ncbi:hypothetical protein [Sphaerisporangium perillae]|nr:hypothetical protein [Sphaerisporangium perillae]